MSKRPRDLSAEDKRLWRRVAATVRTRRPLPDAPEDEASEPVQSVKTKPAPRAEAAAKAAARAPGPLADRGAERRVRRGQVEVEARLDLHGHTQDTGRAALIGFLHRAHQDGLRSVLVITGAGRSGEGVLRKRLREWLEGRDLKSLLAGYAQAHRSHGGNGAFYVFLKRK